MNPVFLVRSMGLTIDLTYVLEKIGNPDKQTEALIKRLNSDNFVMSSSQRFDIRRSLNHKDIGSVYKRILQLVRQS